MKISRHVQAIINAAYNEAKVRSHEYLTPEHVLYASLSFDEVQKILIACGADLEQIKKGMENYFEQKVPISADVEPTQTVGFQSVLERAVMQSQSAQKEELDVADILVSLYDEDRNYCAYYLRKSGVKRLQLLEVISHGSRDQALDDAMDAISESVDEEEEGAEDASQTDGADASAPDIETEPRTKTAKRGALDRFTTDLTALAKEGKLEPVIGRELELERTVQVLCRRLKNNPIHVGDSGVG
ncbi:MAG: Clp protease N-terminal domain-containing protein, partial [Treponemataceae bacterium]